MTRKSSASFAFMLALVSGAVGCGSNSSAGAGGPDASADTFSIEDAPIQKSPWDGNTIATIVMSQISVGVPAFASGSGPGSPPSNANDDNPMTSWSPDALPAWIAYDLSKVPAAQRQNVLVVWNALHAGLYISPSPPPAGNDFPTDFTIEINPAPGGTSAPPTDGWMQVASVSGNVRNTVQRPVALAGANWVRMSITASTDPNTIALDLDVYSTPNGATDCWMLMGDSITYITMGYAFSDLPQLVHQAKADRWPAVINAAIGGTSTGTAVSIIDQTMAGYPGRYVTLDYGTNDNPQTYQMETLVQHVLAAGKIPVVPHMPWSATANIQTNGPMINQQIDALYAKYPQIVRGPDLWAVFTNHPEWIPAGDVHPNQAGQEVLRQTWATFIAAIP